MDKFRHYFALSVFRDKIVLPDAYKQQLVQHVLAMEDQSRQGAATQGVGQPDAAWLGDTRGGEFLFQHPDFLELYRKISAKVLEYLDALGIDARQLVLYYQRSWATVTRRQQRIHEHAHVQSHLTFAYYLRKPQKSGGVYFMMHEHPNEFSPGLFSPAKASLGLIRNPSMLTWNSVLLNTEEDDIVIFPSKTLHATTPSETDEPRISISADIVATLRDSRGHETMMPQPSQWRSFDEI